MEVQCCVEPDVSFSVEICVWFSCVFNRKCSIYWYFCKRSFVIVCFYMVVIQCVHRQHLQSHNSKQLLDNFTIKHSHISSTVYTITTIKRHRLKYIWIHYCTRNLASPSSGHSRNCFVFRPGSCHLFCLQGFWIDFRTPV